MKRTAKPYCRTEALVVLGLVFFFLATAIARAQQSPVRVAELQGRVVEGDSGIADVHVLNLSATTAVISNEEGYFRIQVAAGDTLLFSAVRFKRKSLVVGPDILRAATISVPMEPFVNELDEVVVRPYDLSGDLEADMGRLPEDRTVTSYSLGLPNAYRRPWTPTEKKIHEATTGGGIVPLNPILNFFTGRTKRLKKQLSFERIYAKSQEMRAQVSDSILTHELGVPAERIPDFMYFCEVDSLFGPVTDSGDQLRVWAFLRRKSEEYRENNNLD